MDWHNSNTTPPPPTPLLTWMVVDISKYTYIHYIYVLNSFQSTRIPESQLKDSLKGPFSIFLACFTKHVLANLEIWPWFLSPFDGSPIGRVPDPKLVAQKLKEMGELLADMTEEEACQQIP